MVIDKSAKLPKASINVQKRIRFLLDAQLEIALYIILSRGFKALYYWKTRTYQTRRKQKSDIILNSKI